MTFYLPALIRRHFCAPVLFLIFILICGACTPKGPTGTPPPIAPTAVSILPQAEGIKKAPPMKTVYTVGPFDRLLVTVWRYPEFTGTRTVKEDGTLFLPGAGHVNIKGLTLREAQAKLDAALLKVLNNPEVDIEPVEVRSKVYTILGAVKNPGRYPIFRRTDIPAAIALAGGELPGGGLDRAYLSREGKTYIINVRTLLVRGSADVFLAENDVLYIPTAEDLRVFVLGYVRAPGAVNVAGSGLDLLAAISAAGGFQLGAKKKHVAVLRPGPEGLYAYEVDLKKALKMKADPSKMMLQPGDIVYVPKSGLGAWNEIIQQISPTLNTLVYQPLGAGRDYFYIQDSLNK